MGACGVKKCHGITEQDPLAMQVPVPYMNTTIIIKNRNRQSHEPDRRTNLVYSYLHPLRDKLRHE